MEGFSKDGWTNVDWVSKNIQIQEHVLLLSQIVKEVNSLRDLVGTVPIPPHLSDPNCRPGPSRPRPRPSPKPRVKPRPTSTTDDRPSPKPGCARASESSRPRPTRGRPRGRPRRDMCGGSNPETCARPSDNGEEVSKQLGLKEEVEAICEPCTSDDEEEILIQLGLDEDLDLGLGVGTCYIVSSLPNKNKKRRRPRPRVQLKWEMDLDQLLNDDQLNIVVSENLKEKLKIIPENSCLKTVQIRKNSVGKVRDYYGAKYKDTVFQKVALYEPKAKANDLVPNENGLVLVRVYVPFPRKMEIPPRTHHHRNDPKLSQEIVLLSTQTLAQLRDQILCVADGVVPGECSSNPIHVPDHTAKDVYKSGFFFINNTFYNDFRHQDNIDYSLVLREWATKWNISEFGTRTMEGTRLEDLTVCLGYPYVYQHQGDCEHLLTFSDIRLLHPSECQVSVKYPYVIHEAKAKLQFCYFCGKFSAQWLTLDNSRVPISPCFFCVRCFFRYNYLKGKKVGSFKAYYFKEPIFDML